MAQIVPETIVGKVAVTSMLKIVHVEKLSAKNERVIHAFPPVQCLCVQC